MIDKIEQDARTARRRMRRQLWTVLGVLFLLAIAITAYQEYYARYLASEKPIVWQTMDWKSADRELARGRKMLIVVLDETNAPASQQFLEKFETAEIREQVFRSRLLPLKMSAAPDSEFFAILAERFPIETIPCVILQAKKENPKIFPQGVTSQSISDTIEKIRKSRN